MSQTQGQWPVRPEAESQRDLLPSSMFLLPRHSFSHIPSHRAATLICASKPHCRFLTTPLINQQFR